MLCTLGSSAAKQDSYYLPGCTLTGVDSTRQQALRKNVLTDES